MCQRDLIGISFDLLATQGQSAVQGRQRFSGRDTHYKSQEERCGHQIVESSCVLVRLSQF